MYLLNIIITKLFNNNNNTTTINNNNSFFYLLLLNNNKQIINELVDQIESIDVFTNQLIIITTRQGPPDMAKVMIQIVDIETGEVLPHLNLTGILLLLTRGKYTINWLKPNNWYGIYFRAEQSYNGGIAIYVNEEAYLLKTKRIDEINKEGKQIIIFNILRNEENGNSVENLILKMKWEQPKEERQNLDGLANITLFCNEQINYKQLKLNGNEEEKLIKINLDNNYKINEELNNKNNNKKINKIIIKQLFIKYLKNNGNNFILEKLQNGKYYGVQYTYGKTSPFVYEESQRFLLNTGSLDEPLFWQFNIIDEKGIKPNIIATALLGFKNYEIGVDVEPLCEDNNNNNNNLLHFWLNKLNNKKELPELNILELLCTILPKHNICQIPGNAVMIKGCLINKNKKDNLCWITNIIINEKLYSEKRKCLSLINSVPQLPEKIKIMPGNNSQLNNTKLIEKNNYKIQRYKYICNTIKFTNIPIKKSIPPFYIKISR
ncbi:hypothetical protein Mgra_00002942 [Meloidogyne graminicola]|uniref:Uncharacterized protein n=1 Tax=Meloidogyne graminicola TaxID=189291 RepID=A0A8S9ZVF0_9BILA|nr:hypothetical protein Mgra_00002942 [Meloidogyne graminicola]